MKVPSNIKINLVFVFAIMVLGVFTIVTALVVGAFGIALTSLCGLLATGSILFAGNWFNLK